jgi:hypothetical protein
MKALMDFSGYRLSHGLWRESFPVGLSSILVGEGLGPDAVLPNSYVSEPTGLRDTV